MRFLMRVSWDVEAGNAVVRAGKLGKSSNLFWLNKSRRLCTSLPRAASAAGS